MGAVTGEWWSDLTPAQAVIDCSGQKHTLRWVAGELRTPDHPQPERERALQALGGEPARCLDLADLWARHTDDLDVLVLGSRGPSDPLGALPDEDEGIVGGAFSGFMADEDEDEDEGDEDDEDDEDDADADEDDEHGVHGRSVGFVTYHGSYRPMRGRGMSHLHQESDEDEGPSVDRIEELLTLGGGLAERLGATVVATWATRVRDGATEADDARAALHTALYARASEALRTWLADPGLQVEVDMLAPGDPPTMSRTRSGAIRLGVTFDWLSEVWAPRRALVLDRFVLGIEPVAPRGWQLVTVGVEVGPPSLMSVSW